MATFDEEHSKIRVEDDVHDINILLLGETGVGKSTFINSFINYLQFDKFEEVCANDQNICCLIPTKFTVIDDHFDEKVIEFGTSDNESTSDGESATLKTKIYKFHLPKYDINLRIIDTPGIGDTRGINQDDTNQENIINALSNFKYINAICILLKPNQPRCTVAFQYCINQVLMCMHKTAIKNILFVFTNTSNSFFTPGETVHSLQKVLKDIEEKQNILIPFNRENTYCVDNESFRYLLAQKSGLNIGNEKVFATSWSHSQNEYLRMIQYSMEQTPYNVDNSLYLFKVRNKFEKLCQSQIDIGDLLKNDTVLLKKLQDIINCGDKAEIEDAKNHIKEIEGRIGKYEYEKNDNIMQISKLVTFLQTNSIIVFNNYSETYINYLIDRENSMGSETDRKHIRQLYDRMKYYESLDSIVNMDMHIDPFSPVMSREELSSLFPHLEEDIKTLCNTEYIDEVLFSVSQIHNETKSEENDLPEENTSTFSQNHNQTKSEENDLTEENTSTFTFSKWFNTLSDSASYITEQVENSLHYEELRKQYAKKEHYNVNSKLNINKNNVANKKFPKNNGNFNYKLNLNESRISNNFAIPSGNTIPTPKQGYRRSKSPNKMYSVQPSNFAEFLDPKDDFVFVNDLQGNRGRGAFRGRGRGRGRGNQANSHQSHASERTSKYNKRNENNYTQQSNRSKVAFKAKSEHDRNSKTHYNHNKTQQNNKSKVDLKAKPEHSKNIEGSNNLLQSMKTLFD